MRLVLCYGIFDQPLETYGRYFHEARLQGDELHVIVIRDRTVLEAHDQLPLMGERQRLDRVQSHPLVERAYLAHPEEPLRLIELIRPHVCVLGEERQGLPDGLETELIRRGIFLPVHTIAHFSPNR
jgi:glycerol-3-phosphate cytidylyltransferase-like family protein